MSFTPAPRWLLFIHLCSRSFWEGGASCLFRFRKLPLAECHALPPNQNGGFKLSTFSPREKFGHVRVQVLHIISPSYDGTKVASSFQRLVESITECLVSADSLHLQNIAIPAVGTGASGFPPELASRAIVTAVERCKQLSFFAVDTVKECSNSPPPLYRPAPPRCQSHCRHVGASCTYPSGGMPGCLRVIADFRAHVEARSASSVSSPTPRRFCRTSSARSGSSLNNKAATDGPIELLAF